MKRYLSIDNICVAMRKETKKKKQNKTANWIK